MAKSFLFTQSLHLGGVGLLLVGLAVACEQEPSKPTHSPSTGGTTGAGTGGTGGTVDGGPLGDGGEATDEVRKGERGSSCDSSNDCEEGLSCIVSDACPPGVACANKSCQPSNFEIMGTGKQCHVIDCATTADCCGDKPLETPDKCVDRERICNQPTLLDCTTNLSCLEDTDCGSGFCTGTCAYDSDTTDDTLDFCQATTDCAENDCDTSENPDTCAVTKDDCSATTCPIISNTCSALRCNCVNPDYDPTDPICSDPDCDDICGFVCKDERCVTDTSCDSDLDCAVTTPFCGDDGVCVECLTSDDCEDEDVECVEGHCGPECEKDTQCAVFETCQANECVFVGCQSDRECVLSATGTDPTHDPRLAKCHIEAGIGTCIFPCDIDAQCAPTEVCLNGVCEYIGCETDGECKTIEALHNQPAPTEERPWVTTAECRAETTPLPAP